MEPKEPKSSLLADTIAAMERSMQRDYEEMERMPRLYPPEGILEDVDPALCDKHLE